MDIIPEILDYFKNFELEEKDVSDIEDIDLLPNLKKMTLFYDDNEEILEKLNEKGIEGEWL